MGLEEWSHPSFAHVATYLGSLGWKMVPGKLNTWFHPDPSILIRVSAKWNSSTYRVDIVRAKRREQLIPLFPVMDEYDD